MNGDRFAEAMFVSLALILPLSALIVRRIPMARAAKLAVVWATIIIGMTLLIGVVRGGMRARSSAEVSMVSREEAALQSRPLRSAHIQTLHNIYYQDA